MWPLKNTQSYFNIELLFEVAKMPTGFKESRQRPL